MQQSSTQQKSKNPSIYQRDFFHLATKLGGLGIQSLEDNLEAARITKCIKCLTSKDKWISDVAWDQQQATDVRVQPPDHEQILIDVIINGILTLIK